MSWHRATTSFNRIAYTNFRKRLLCAPYCFINLCSGWSRCTQMNLYQQTYYSIFVFILSFLAIFLWMFAVLRWSFVPFSSISNPPLSPCVYVCVSLCALVHFISTNCFSICSPWYHKWSSELMTIRQIIRYTTLHYNTPPHMNEHFPHTNLSWIEYRSNPLEQNANQKLKLIKIMRKPKRKTICFPHMVHARTRAHTHPTSCYPLHHMIIDKACGAPSIDVYAANHT